MVISQDRLPSFIPASKPKMVIFGTMVAICARSLNGQTPQEKVFYYHNNRNHFWRVMQHLLQPKKEVKKMTVLEKKKFLDTHGIVIANLVGQIEVPNSEAHDPSDTILFKAHKKGRLNFKKASPTLKKILKDTPLYFTCRHKKGIEDLVKGYLEFNQMQAIETKDIWYLPTPTRCNPQARADMWRQEIQDHQQQLGMKPSF